jgi:N-acetylglucosaminyldiphosphoundecaprenol N-acetyl-beta-D-mannosaminyltransferase
MTEITTLPLLGYKIFTGDKEFFATLSPGVINTLNPHCCVLARGDECYNNALLNSDYLIPDGIGIQLSALILAGSKIDKIAGSDLHAVILDSLEKGKGSCFYLGSSETTLKKIIDRLAKEKPEIRTGSFSPPYKDYFNVEENEAMIKAVNDFRPDVLFVGMTAPKQEKWVYQHSDKLNVPTICSIGAVFDFYAGTVKRPDKIWINLGLEWLGRLLKEPKRMWRRNFVSTPLFLYYVLVEKIRLVFSTGRR